jgi:DNA-binding NarL/FixJ family response regulator
VTSEPAQTTVRTLLIVDDQDFVCRALSRVLKYRFDRVLTANDPDQALQRLAQSPVTHLVCDCNLGPRFRYAFEYVPGWRRICPTIERAVVYSGSGLVEIEVPPGVDAVLPKTADPKQLLRALGCDT